MIVCKCQENMSGESSNVTQRLRSKTVILSLEPKAKIYTRFATYIAFFVVIFGFGIPTWYWTTSIPKENLAIEDMVGYEQNIDKRFQITVPVYVNPPSSAMESLIENTQTLVDQNLKQILDELQLNDRLDYQVKLMNNNNQIPFDVTENYLVNIKHSEENQESVFIAPYSKEITVFTSDAVIAANHVADFVAKVLIYDVFRHELELYVAGDDNNLHVAFETAANYHLSFFLLNGDGDYISWDFKDFYDQYLSDFMQLISGFANFTVDSQIGYYSTLSTTPQYDNESQSYYLTPDDTSIFVNHELWNLDNNVLISPTNDKGLTFLHMILYVPSKQYQPLHVQGSKTDSFITPQYGGIKILNLNTDTGLNTLTVDDLVPVFETFTSQIFTLLGLPKTPKSPFIRVDFLTRYFIINNLKKSTNNLGSLVRLIKSLPSISIPVNTKTHVFNTFQSIEKSLVYLNNFDLKNSAKSANMALVESNSAFFEKEMVQQIYFPEEHKFAVYSPLLGPLLTILVLGLIRLSQDLKTLKKYYYKKDTKVE